MKAARPAPSFTFLVMLQLNEEGIIRKSVDGGH